MIFKLKNVIFFDISLNVIAIYRLVILSDDQLTSLINFEISN